ncbi:aa3-type cytochrome c oxidase subunit IV [Phenylobacterium sp.]|uniref:aa3-type cytochrome c oxidase subunit IV n=1 Tax=Phenylobacterium sp. TaxID=1871053 RepID=UPI0025D3012D|nr:aa3-type cytochrome c oxidase subunit IV [Phenylobacterium sp.]MBX3484621.1 aa3-type cytochrome c oxidase subunit IV [Phenylobacterium sp.]MCW5759964.1 aa3-type cytochrome c oxidase subunit IV [Phenylobacterium sp.]
MAGHGSDYQRGHMDIAEQSATYELVMGMTKWGSLVVAAGILFFTLLFCTHTGFLGSAITAAVLLALGVFFLRAKPAEAGAH